MAASFPKLGPLPRPGVHLTGEGFHSLNLRSMSVAEIVKEVPNLSLEEMKEVARAAPKAMEDAGPTCRMCWPCWKIPGQPVPMSEIRKSIISNVADFP